ncbi:MAG TPA: hypothetical protein VI759_03825 [Dehalococcoidia bacterium]|nr:hypothetical protein [Dehalococcoidia bacterium]
MTLFNRIVLALIFLVVAAGAAALSALAWSIPDDSINQLREIATWLDDHNTDGTKIIITAVAGGIGVIALGLAIWELLPKAPAEVKVTDLRVGDAVLSTAAIGQRVEEAVSQVAHVADARATIKAKRKGVIVSLDLHVDPEANLAAVTDEACQAAQDVLTNRVHVAMAAPPTARLHYRELRLRSGQPRRVVPAPAAPTPTVHPAPPPEPPVMVDPEPETVEEAAMAPVATEAAAEAEAPAEPVATVEEGKRKK